MTYFRVVSIADPLREPVLASLCLGLLARGQVMGFLPDGVGAETRLDLDLVGRVGTCLARLGIAREPALALSHATDEGVDVADALRRTLASVDASPQPAGEWEPARELLGDDLLARLVGVSASSLHRYASGVRRTPDEVAWRLHAVARILAALVGSYNGYGIRRWFDRPRRQLDDRTPAELVASARDEDDEELRAAIELAESLAGAGFAT